MFKIDQKVWDIVWENGKVISKDMNVVYAVSVEFNHGGEIFTEQYTIDGKLYIYDEKQRLFPEEMMVISKKEFNKLKKCN